MTSARRLPIKSKKLGDVRQLNIDDVDSIIKDFHADVSAPSSSGTLLEENAKRQKNID